jgi:hypothetical protein
MGLRRADARTGGPITVRSAAIGFAVHTASGAVLSELFSPLERYQQRRLDSLRPKVEEIEDRYRDDETARQNGLMQLYRRENANPFGGCVLVIPRLLVGLAPSLFDPYHRSLADRVAGIIVLDQS